MDLGGAASLKRGASVEASSWLVKPRSHVLAGYCRICSTRLEKAACARLDWGMLGSMSWHSL